MPPPAADILLRFDFVDAGGCASPRVFSRPERVLVARQLDEVMPIMRAVDDAIADGWYAAGFVAYEAAPAFDAALAAHASRDVPLVWFALFRDTVQDLATVPAVRDGEARTAHAGTGPDHGVDAAQRPWISSLEPGEYARSIARVREAIASGDSYQSNYTFRLHTDLDPDRLLRRYLGLRDDHRPPYAAWLDTGEWRMLSLSPELCFRIDERRVTSRPMKGTATRGLWLEDDRARATALAESPKNRAEHVMIVDLVRNDIGRIAQVGSVRASSLFDIERYATVFQMVSTVEGVLRPEARLSEVFSALFPAGSVTGAPKTSSMKLIAEVERSPRGVYCGAIGYATPHGEAVFNVAIRTAVADVRTGRAVYGVGGGITWDSTPEDEYVEALSKAICLTPAPAFRLLETMRCDAAGCIRLDQHLRRMADSAQYFDFVWDEARVREAVHDATRSRGVGPLRVRLTLTRDGRPTVECRAIDEVPQDRARVALARTAVSSADRFLYHKTTHRAVYEQRRAERPDMFDVLLWNERGQVTEFTIGNIVVERGGQRWTPPRAAGLLAGTFRADLLARHVIHEHELLVEDLESCARVWLINSVREWVEVTLERP